MLFSCNILLTILLSSLTSWTLPPRSWMPTPRQLPNHWIFFPRKRECPPSAESAPRGIRSCSWIETLVLYSNLRIFVAEKQIRRLLLFFWFVELCGWHLASWRLHWGVHIFLYLLVFDRRIVESQSIVGVHHILAVMTWILVREVMMVVFLVLGF